MGGASVGAFCAPLRVLCHNRCKVQCIIPISSHGQDEAQVLQYLFKQGIQLEFAFCMREMMEHRRKQVTAMGEVLAQVWDEKVSVIFDNEVGKVQDGGEGGEASGTCPILLPEDLYP